MTDEQLRNMTERELKARFNAAPDYLETLLARKRALDEGTLWEINLGRRADSRHDGGNV
jgi:hypothetical protein